ncbi:N(G),N(G)-dimethylarginine dimethylaminohydrolase 1-like isoform X1 [Watersipora subatra]|uniref:N(G),N(G)-dimethylarginine dimethylaminohydrolase 1-like isoform X1 n=1 Tax=Watersipora subatra TaxID=2589382 RepID=UPI00355BC18D
MSSVDVPQYHYALVSAVPSSFAKRSLKSAAEQPIDLALAIKQHDAYVEGLRRLGLNILEIPSDEKHPESPLIADTAVVINGTALICNPSNRRIGETSIVRSTLLSHLHLRIVELHKEQAKLEGTDVLFTGKEIIVGIGEFTNKEGAQCVAEAFPEYAVSIVTLPKEVRHLQQVMTMAGPDIILVPRGNVGQSCLREVIARSTFTYRVTRVEEREAANCLYVNGVILHLDHSSIPDSYPVLESKFDNRLAIEYSELLKGGSFLSAGAILVCKPSSFSPTFQTSLVKGHHEL